MRMPSTRLPTARRVALGVARTVQNIALYGARQFDPLAHPVGKRCRRRVQVTGTPWSFRMSPEAACQPPQHSHLDRRCVLNSVRAQAR